MCFHPFRWESGKGIKSISLTISDPKLVMVVGETASGKVCIVEKSKVLFAKKNNYSAILYTVVISATTSWRIIPNLWEVQDSWKIKLLCPKTLDFS